MTTKTTLPTAFAISFMILFMTPFKRSFAQNRDSIPKKKENPTTNSFPLNNHKINKITSNFFGNLITSNNSAGVLGNFASLDASSGTFNFQGTIAIGNMSDTNTKKNISFLTLSGKGDIVGGSFATLLTNSSLNTGAFLTANYHIMLKQPTMVVNSIDVANYRLKGYILKEQYKRDTSKYSSKSSAKNKVEIDQLKAKLTVLIEEIKIIEHTINVSTLSITYKQGNLNTITITEEKQKSIKEINDLEEAIKKLESNLATQKKNYDSTKYAIEDYINLKINEYEKAIKKYKKLEDSLLLTLPIPSLSFSWLTFTGSTGKQNYITYDPTAAFDNQISKKNYQTYEFGISYNFVYKDFERNRIFYLNAGAARLATNNINLLSTKAITDTRKVVNGDITRTVEKKYNAYTDPIITDQGLKLFLHTYYMFGKKPSGIHVFPDVTYQDNKTTIANLGLGYIVSFINTKKDQPLINLEAYFKLKDITDQGSSGIDGVLNRNELGFSFTLPINFFTKN